MTNRKKGILNTVFLFLVFGITMYCVFHGQNLSELLTDLKQMNLCYCFVGVICVIIFIGSESVIIYYMMRKLKQKVILRHCFLYSFVGFFFSCITPSASGGQPAQIYYMKKDEIPIPMATLVLMIVTITYKLVLVVLGLIILILRPSELMTYLQPVIGWCYLGIALNVFCVISMLLLVFHPTLAYRIVTGTSHFLNRIGIIKKSSRFVTKIDRSMKLYQDVAAYFYQNKIVVFNVFLITVFQRLLLFFVTYLTYLAFGLHAMSAISIVLLQGMISVSVDMLPLPGGMGISERLFMKIFTPIFGVVALPAMIVSRGISYYTQLLISAFMTIVAQLTIGTSEKGM